MEENMGRFRFDLSLIIFMMFFVMSLLEMLLLVGVMMIVGVPEMWIKDNAGTINIDGHYLWVALIFAPIIEELIFRKFLLRKILKYNATFAVIFVSF